jgi:hypothetical protein
VRSDEYLRDALQSELHPGDCVTHAIRLAELLLEEGRAPWIGRIRDVEGDFHHPLIPRRFVGVTWNTHYVACSGRDVYDPLAGERLDVAEHALRVFGKRLHVAMHVTVGDTAALLRAGQLRQRFRVRRD